MTSPAWHRALTTTGLAVGLSAGAALLAGPAFAASYAVDDPAGDVTTFERDGTVTPNPGNRVADLVSARYDYRTRYLVVVGTARDVGGSVQPVVTIAAGRDRFVYNGRPNGTVGTDYGVEIPACRGATATRNTATDTYRMKIPSSCLGSPGSVRVALTLTRPDQASYASTNDDIQAGRLSPRISRG